MKKKLLGLGLMGLSVLGLASCGDDSTYSYKYTYNVKVIDIDGEELLDHSFHTNEHSDMRVEIKDYTSLSGSDDLTTGFKVKSIAGSVIDNNYNLVIYENGVKTDLGIDSLYVDDGDEFVFQVECWNSVASGYGSLDENDILLDQAFYKYVKKEMPKVLKAGEAFDSSDYWTYMMISFMKNHSYSPALFNTNKATTAMKTSISKQSVSALTGASVGKYYYTARALGTDLSDFKDAYKTYLGTITEYGEYGEFTRPFDVSPAYTLGYSEYVADSVKTPSYIPSTEYGYDGYSWFVASTALFNEYDSNSFNLPLTDQGNLTSNACLLMAHAALNNSAKELADLLVTNYYDSETGYLIYQPGDENGISFESANQAYAGIAAYKVQRDKKIAANIFE